MMNERINGELMDNELENVVGGATREEVVNKVMDIVDKAVRKMPVVGPIWDLFRR